MADEGPVFTEGDYPGLHMLEEIRVDGPIPWLRVLTGVFGFWPWSAAKYKLEFTFLIAFTAAAGWFLCSGGDARLFWSIVIAALVFPVLVFGSIAIPLNIHRAVTRKQR